MRLLAFLLLCGIASASVHEALDDAADEFLVDFLEGMENAPSLGEHLAVDDSDADVIEDKVKTSFFEKLKENLRKILEKVKESVEEGKTIKEEYITKIKELKEQLKALKERLGDKGKAIIDNVKERIRNYLKELLDKLGSNKRATEDRFDEALSELNIRDILIQVREHLKKNVDPELLKEKIEKIFGQGSELLRQLLQTLKEKGKKKVLILIDQLLGDDDDVAKRGVKDYWEKVKNYFKDLKIDLQEKYAKFGEWVKDTLDKGMEHSKDKMENIKAIAKEFAKHAKGISKEVAAEAGEFFKNYKDELGIVWDEIKEKIAQITNKKD